MAGRGAANLRRSLSVSSVGSEAMQRRMMKISPNVNEYLSVSSVGSEAMQPTLNC